MRIAIVSVQVPFINGGAELLAYNLKNQLIKKGYNADIVTIPFKWYPEETLMNSMLIAKLIDLNEVNGVQIDKLIVLKFPAYYVNHPNKVLWLLHQHRQIYELWGTEYGDVDTMPHGNALREVIINNDNKCFSEIKNKYTISQTVSDRLLKYNGIKSNPLYHPPINFESLFNSSYENYIFYPSRIDKIKRQYILIESLLFTKSPTKIIFSGSKDGEEYIKIKRFIDKHKLGDRVIFKGVVSEEEKRNLYASALGIYNGPYMEDYGYVTLEAFYSRKPVITLNDSGGPLEFVDDAQNGFVAESTPEIIAEKIDYLYYNKHKAKEYGDAGYEKMLELKINWDHVIEELVK